MSNFLKWASICCVIFIFSCGDDDDDDVSDTVGDNSDLTAVEIIVNAHNEYRSEVGVPDIEWSEDLAESAQKWANELASNCNLQHSDSEFGENIWMGTTGFFTPEDVVDSWGEEIQFYDVDDNECKGGECLHYTQIVWEGSTEVGCGMVTCDGFDIWVCQYNPAGNIIGQRPF